MENVKKSKEAEVGTASIVLLVVLALIWGSSFILMKKAMYGADGSPIFSSEQVASLRISLAALFLLPFAFRKETTLSKKDWFYLGVSGVVGSMLPAFLFTAAQTRIPSALAGMLNTLTPLFTFAVGVLFFQLKFRNTGLLGILIGLVGSVSLIFFRNEGPIQIDPYAMLVVLATLLYGSNINVIKRHLSHLPSLLISSLSLVLVAPITIAYAYFLNTQEVMLETKGSGMALLYIVLLALFSTSLGLILFNRLIKMVSPLFASSVTYFIPIAAIAWGLVDGEKIGWTDLVSIALILLGVWFVNKR